GRDARAPPGGRRGLCRGGAAEPPGGGRPPQNPPVRAALAGSGLPEADHAWGVVERRLDGYAAEWATAHRDVCEATQVRGEQSADLLDRRMACLRQEREELRALVDVLAKNAPGTAARAVVAAYGLQPTSAWAAAPKMGAPRSAPDPAFPAELAAAHALVRAGQYEAGLAAAEKLLGHARALGDPDAEALALLALGDAQRERQQLEPA